MESMVQRTTQGLLCQEDTVLSRERSQNPLIKGCKGEDFPNFLFGGICDPSMEGIPLDIDQRTTQGNFQLSNEKNLGWLGYIGDYTT